MMPKERAEKLVTRFNSEGACLSNTDETYLQELITAQIKEAEREAVDRYKLEVIENECVMQGDDEIDDSQCRLHLDRMKAAEDEMSKQKLCGCGSRHLPQYVCNWKIVNAWADKCDRLTAERDGLKADGLALLARLEAAEEYCKIQGPSTLGAEKAYKAWRKAASKL